MAVDIARIRRDIEAIAAFGALPGGGVTRLAFSPEDLAARRYLAAAMESAALAVKADAFGNMRGRREGKEDLPPVLVGSHLDTVPSGGNYDGVVGVVGALEVMRALQDEGVVTRRPIEMINFSCEESSRFGVGTLGSKAMVGKLLPPDLDRLVDKNGVSLREALAAAGYDPDGLGTVRAAPGSIHAFLELHIEQGPVLEAEGQTIGIVSSIAAPTRFKVRIKGRADHSGTTPMRLRRDALAGASELVLGLERIAACEAGETTVGTVGYAIVKPGAMNVVPGEVELGVDIRDIDRTGKDAAVSRFKALLNAVAARRNLVIDAQLLGDEEPVPLSPRIIACLTELAGASKMAFRVMPSGAGHDAMYMAGITDAGMIFVPSAGGISHNIAEATRLEDIAQGAELLLKAVRRLAEE